MCVFMVPCDTVEQHPIQHVFPAHAWLHWPALQDKIIPEDDDVSMVAKILLNSLNDIYFYKIDFKIKPI